MKREASPDGAPAGGAGGAGSGQLPAIKLETDPQPHSQPHVEQQQHLEQPQPQPQQQPFAQDSKRPRLHAPAAASADDVVMADASAPDAASTAASTPAATHRSAEVPPETLARLADELVAEKLKNNKALITERQGIVQFRFVENDGTDESMILLTGLKNIFQRQLPNMPKEYIARLVYDRTHHHMAVVRLPLTVLGGITYRPFDKRNFAEIVFCAITSSEQVQGYGSRLMSHVKDYVRDRYNIWNFLTYADNYAIGYFKKQARRAKGLLMRVCWQGFTTDITLEKHLWIGYIKDYEGGTIMQCTMVRKVNYLEVVNTIVAQRWAVFKRIREATKSRIVHPGLQAFHEGATYVDPATIPGLLEAGWSPGLVSTRPAPRERGPLYIFMKKLTTELKEDDNSWPFLEPVAGVPDYYDIIKEPMECRNDKYSNSDHYYKDVMLIFSNCRTYNEDSSPYVRCAVRVEKQFKERFKMLKAEMRVI
ncbi:hypothetical protein BC831DRAFT_508835 [Entophlyctis helioformis]|nr:hypothetical protein BC831DRAFT_508835 [Entophlyctis helioformis]